ncbi:MAG: HD domain-containing protein, partial [Anaerolineales bacterium]|nr:HD domain-containing protein [Anaerolineales bacterium]
MSANSPAYGDDLGSGDSPYAGRWVARVRGKIVAHGGTPKQARRAAKLSRSKEISEISYMPTSQKLFGSPLLDTVIQAVSPQQPLYLIGGAVRDALLGKSSHDLDFGLPGDAMRVARQVAKRIGAAFFPLDDKRGTARLVLLDEDGSRQILDFAAFRGNDLETDLRGRDFTLNAIAYDLHAQTVLDPLGGVADLHAKQLRLCAASSLDDDPVRVLRAVRQAADFGFHILPETRAAMKNAVPALKNVSAERQRDELFRILEGRQPATAFQALEMLGVFKAFLPELAALKDLLQSPPHVQDVWRHTLGALKHLDTILGALAPQYDARKASDYHHGLLVLRIGRYREQIGRHFAQPLTVDRSVRSLLFMAALYHDIAKPLTGEVGEGGRMRFWGHEVEGAEMAVERARMLRLSNDEIDRLRRIVRGHMRVHALTQELLEKQRQPSRRAIYRFFRDTREAGVDVILLSLADLRATYEHTLPEAIWAAALDISRLLLENWWERPAETVSPPRLVDGHDVMQAFGLRSGPQVGRLLEAIREAQATGAITTREAALTFGAKWLKEQGAVG